MNSIGKVVIVVIALAILGAGGYFYIHQSSSSSSTKLTLPIGSFVYYNQQGQNSSPEYTFRYGSINGENPNIFQVWAGTSTSNPEEFPVQQGATYPAYNLQITVSEVHFDYIVISVKG